MLELKNITFGAQDNGAYKEIINGVDLKVADGRLVVITGPNGGGKSTLARLIAGIEKPTGGSILLDGRDVTQTTITERAKMGVGFAFQHPVRFKGLTVLDLLRIAAGREITVSEACEFLSEVGLCAKDYIDREINASLSGGEVKRVEIATILAGRSTLAIFDEPEAGIDLWSFKNLIRIFENLREGKTKRTVIVISHQERILNIADEIVVLAGGKIARQGPREEILPAIIGSGYATKICPRIEEGGK